MKVILEERHQVLTEYGGYRLVYELLESPSGELEQGRSWFGIRICQIREPGGELFDVCQISRVTQDYHEAKAVFQVLAEGLVMPVSLADIIHDWRIYQFL